MYYRAEKNHICFEKHSQPMDYVKTIIVFSRNVELYEAKIIEHIARLAFIGRRIRTAVNYIGTSVSVEITGLDMHTQKIKDKISGFVSKIDTHLILKLEKSANDDLNHMMKNHFFSFLYRHYSEVLHMTENKEYQFDIMIDVMKADYYQFRYCTNNICNENNKSHSVTFDLVKNYLDNPIDILPAIDIKPHYDMNDGYTTFLLGFQTIFLITIAVTVYSISCWDNHQLICCYVNSDGEDHVLIKHIPPICTTMD